MTAKLWQFCVLTALAFGAFAIVWTSSASTLSNETHSGPTIVHASEQRAVLTAATETADIGQLGCTSDQNDSKECGGCCSSDGCATSAIPPASPSMGVDRRHTVLKPWPDMRHRARLLARLERPPQAATQL
jgi:hypothetical protein